MTTAVRSADGIYRTPDTPINSPASEANHHAHHPCAHCNRRKPGLLPRQVAGKWGPVTEMVCISCTAKLNSGKPITAPVQVKPEMEPSRNDWTMEEVARLVGRTRLAVALEINKRKMGQIEDAPAPGRNIGQKRRLLRAGEVEELVEVYRLRDLKGHRRKAKA